MQLAKQPERVTKRKKRVYTTLKVVCEIGRCHGWKDEGLKGDFTVDLTMMVMMVDMKEEEVVEEMVKM